MLSTRDMGGVQVTPQQLREMQAGDYILHARAGKLQKVPVKKTRLPVDPKGHVQILGLLQAPDGTLYAHQLSQFTKSTDGGKTWEHFERDPSQFGDWILQINSEGRWLNISRPPNQNDTPVVWTTDDHGETWEQYGGFDFGPVPNGGVDCVTRLQDGTLLAASRCGDTEYVLHSHDGGRSFRILSERSAIGAWCCEVNLMASSPRKLIAVCRYQREKFPDDPPDLHEQLNAPEDTQYPYKHLFLADSEDGGRSWHNLRQVTTVYGQCHGAGAALSKNRVVVAHDHRYPRETAGARAMVSLDGGRSWENEVYYLNHGHAAGYTRILSVDGEEMIALLGSAYGDVGEWANCIGKSYFVLLRWKLV